MSTADIKMIDALGAAESYLHSMRLMSEAVFKGEGKDYCAFDLLIDSVSIEIANAYAAFNDLTRTGGGEQGHASEISTHTEDECRFIDQIGALRKRLGEIIEDIDRSGK